MNAERNMRREGGDQEPPTGEDRLAALTEKVQGVINAVESIGELTVTTAAALQELRKIRDQGDSRVAIERREAARQEFMAKHDASVAAAEAALAADGPRQFLVMIVGGVSPEPAMVRVVAGENEPTAIKRYEQFFGIVQVFEQGKRIEARALTGAEAEELTSALNLAPPIEKAKKGRELLGLPQISPSFAPLHVTAAV